MGVAVDRQAGLQSEPVYGTDEVAGFAVSILMSLKFNTVLNSMLNSPKFCQR